MNSAVKKAIENVDRLFEQQTEPESWANNLIEASRELKNPADWTLFYAYITDPKHFDPEHSYSTMGDKFDKMKLDPYQEGMIVNTYANGSHDTIIHIKNESLYKKMVKEDDVEDEKNPL